LEQVIVNLVVNAVHAMPNGGRLTLETHSVILDEDYARSHSEAQAGLHVLLVVSDTGHGMDATTRERIFEPFFTTKPTDKGTGLGLATVHGIVKQSGGHITVYSEPGHGTTFKVYLPAIEQALADEPPASQLAEAPGGHETILLCEDDEPVRELIDQALRTAGYHLITANRAEQALAAAAAHVGPIELLITDVIMPNMNGRALSERISTARPGLRTVFISGYTSDVIAHHGVLDKGVEFLEKPFTRRELLTKVRAVLDKAGVDS
jgi:CheY-like chemotaxis protein